MINYKKLAEQAQLTGEFEGIFRDKTIRSYLSVLNPNGLPAPSGPGVLFDSLGLTQTVLDNWNTRVAKPEGLPATIDLMKKATPGNKDIFLVPIGTVEEGTTPEALEEKWTNWKSANDIDPTFKALIIKTQSVNRSYFSSAFFEPPYGYKVIIGPKPYLKELPEIPKGTKIVHVPSTGGAAKAVEHVVNRDFSSIKMEDGTWLYDFLSLNNIPTINVVAVGDSWLHKKGKFKVEGVGLLNVEKTESPEETSGKSKPRVKVYVAAELRAPDVGVASKKQKIDR